VHVDESPDAPAWARAWSELAAPFRRCVELAWESCASGTFACGAVITDRVGNVVAEGRNRAFDEPSGKDPLEATVLAHAEMNALARVPTGVALDDCTLWSSLEPCLMCLSSALLSSVGEIRYLAPDPLWDGLERLPSLNAFVERRWPVHHEPHDGEWAVLGMTFALHLFAFWQPVDSQALAAHDRSEPETSALVRRWVTDRTLVDLASTGATVEQALATVWDDVSDAARSRSTRTGIG
jgi:tRNA(Arg) A34 adenosine deaminase TadA